MLQEKRTLVLDTNVVCIGTSEDPRAHLEVGWKFSPTTLTIDVAPAAAEVGLMKNTVGVAEVPPVLLVVTLGLAGLD